MGDPPNERQHREKHDEREGGFLGHESDSCRDPCYGRALCRHRQKRNQGKRPSAAVPAKVPIKATAEEAECTAYTRTNGSDGDAHLRRDNARRQVLEVPQNDRSTPRFL